ncbi:MAG: aminomethyltransferase [Clostridia bacterium]|nr:aminomethyltransferase [Clostridia bacterium]
MTDLKKTPLYEEHVALGSKMAEVGGWLMPIQYSGIIEEHNQYPSIRGSSVSLKC